MPTVHQRHGRTDGQTDGRLTTHYALHSWARPRGAQLTAGPRLQLGPARTLGGHTDGHTDTRHDLPASQK